ncbi:MAG: hypothetical protein ACK5DG_14875 [Chitinophagaceae bacterium]|jgi:hypothetical protein
MKNFNQKLLIAFLLSLTILSCKKDIYTKADPVVLNIQKEVTNWFQNVKTNLTDTVQKLTNVKLAGLDYSAAQVIKKTNSETNIYFIKTGWQNEKYSEYVSFAKTDEIYETVGLIRVTRRSTEIELENIKGFITSSTLDPEFKLMFYGLNKRHIMTYEGLKEGGIKQIEVINNEIKLGKSGVRNTTMNSSANGCIDWYMVTTYTYPDGTQYQTEQYLTTTCNGNNDCQSSDPNAQNLECLSPPGGGNAGGSPTGGQNDYPDDGKLSCKSLGFRAMTSNMYEAGVSGLQFVMDIAGGGNITHNFRSVYVGFPSHTANGTTYSAGEAAAITAYAMNKAGMTMSITYFGMNAAQASLITTTQLENEFKTLVQLYINQEINAGSTVSFIQSGSNTITKSAVWNSSFEQLWNGLTGSGCK